MTSIKWLGTHPTDSQEGYNSDGGARTARVLQEVDDCLEPRGALWASVNGASQGSGE